MGLIGKKTKDESGWFNRDRQQKARGAKSFETGIIIFNQKIDNGGPMKAVVTKTDLYDHRNIVKSAKPTKAILSGAMLTITISDRFSVVGPGFEHSIDCEALQWGTITIPYITWDKLLQSLKFVQANTVTIAAEVGQIQLDTLKMKHPDIKVTRRDRIPLALPINANPFDFLKLLSVHDLEQLKASGISNTIKEAQERLRGQLNQAANLLGEYGVRSEDLALVVSKKLGVKEHELFVKNIFEIFES